MRKDRPQSGSFHKGKKLQSLGFDKAHTAHGRHSDQAQGGGVVTIWPWDSVRVQHLREGYYVIAPSGAVMAGPYPTNSEAWRAYDRLAMEPLNSMEDVYDWSIAQRLLRDE